MLANIETQGIYMSVQAAVADLHYRTQPNGIALNPDAVDILDRLALYGYLPYVEPLTGDNQKLGEIVLVDGVLTKQVIEKTAEEIRNEVVPFSVTMRQARLVLLQAGLLGTVSQAVSAIGGAAEIEWEYGSEVQRDNPLIGMVASQAGMTMQQIDQLFIQASQL